MLDEHAILEHGDLRAITLLTDDHHPVDGLPAGEELRLGEDRRAAAPRLTSFTTTLLLGLEPGRPLEAGDIVAALGSRLPHTRDRVRRIIGRTVCVIGGTTAATTATAANTGALLAFRVILAGLGLLVVARALRLAIFTRPAAATAAPAAAATTAALLALGLVIDGVGGLGLAVGRCLGVGGRLSITGGGSAAARAPTAGGLIRVLLRSRCGIRRLEERRDEGGGGHAGARIHGLALGSLHGGLLGRLAGRLLRLGGLGLSGRHIHGIGRGRGLLGRLAGRLLRLGGLGLSGHHIDGIGRGLARALGGLGGGLLDGDGRAGRTGGGTAARALGLGG